MAFTRHKNFQTGPNGAVCCPDGTLPDDGLDNVAKNSQPDVVYSNDVPAISGDYCGKIQTAIGNSKAGGFVYNLEQSLAGDELWFRTWFRLPTGWLGTSFSQWKYHAIHCETADDNHVGYHYVNIRTDLSGFVYSNEPATTSYNITTAAPIPLDEWQLLEQYIKIGSGTDGIIRLWHNETLVLEAINVATLGPSGFKFGNAQLMFTSSPADEGYASNSAVYVDEIIFTNVEPAGRDAADNPMIGILAGENVAVSTPTITSAAIDTAGTTLIITLSEFCSTDVGHTDTDFTIKNATTDVSRTLSVFNLTNGTITYTIDPIYIGEILELTYTAPGSGIVGDSTGLFLQTTSLLITSGNNSTQTDAVLSNPVASPAINIEGVFTVDTDTISDGNLHWVRQTYEGEPTSESIATGESQAVTSSTGQSIALTNLTSGQQYWVYCMQVGASGAYSTIATANFTAVDFTTTYLITGFVNDDGTSISAVASVPLEVNNQTGFTIPGYTLPTVSADGATLNITGITPTINGGDDLQITYTSPAGDAIQAVTGGVDLGSFGPVTIPVNNSEQGAPVVLSAVINQTGTKLTINLSKPVTVNNSTGFTVDVGGALSNYVYTTNKYTLTTTASSLISSSPFDEYGWTAGVTGEFPLTIGPYQIVSVFSQDQGSGNIQKFIAIRGQLWEFPADLSWTDTLHTYDPLVVTPGNGWSGTKFGGFSANTLFASPVIAGTAYTGTTVNPSVVSGKANIVYDLADIVEAGQTVLLSYSGAPANAIEDSGGTDLEDFTGGNAITVDNQSNVSPAVATEDESGAFLIGNIIE